MNDNIKLIDMINELRTDVNKLETQNRNQKNKNSVGGPNDDMQASYLDGDIHGSGNTQDTLDFYLQEQR